VLKVKIVVAAVIIFPVNEKLPLVTISSSAASLASIVPVPRTEPLKVEVVAPLHINVPLASTLVAPVTAVAWPFSKVTVPEVIVRFVPIVKAAPPAN